MTLKDQILAYEQFRGGRCVELRRFHAFAGGVVLGQDGRMYNTLEEARAASLATQLDDVTTAAVVGPPGLPKSGPLVRRAKLTSSAAVVPCASETKTVADANQVLDQCKLRNRESKSDAFASLAW